MGTLNGSFLLHGPPGKDSQTHETPPPLGPTRTAPVSTQAPKGQHWRDPRPTLQHGKASMGQAGRRAGSRPHPFEGKAFPCFSPEGSERYCARLEACVCPRCSRVASSGHLSSELWAERRQEGLRGTAGPRLPLRGAPAPGVGRTCPQRGGPGFQKGRELIAKHGHY